MPDAGETNKYALAVAQAQTTDYTHGITRVIVFKAALKVALMFHHDLKLITEAIRNAR